MQSNNLSPRLPEIKRKSILFSGNSIGSATPELLYKNTEFFNFNFVSPAKTSRQKIHSPAPFQERLLTSNFSDLKAPTPFLGAQSPQSDYFEKNQESIGKNRIFTIRKPRTKSGTMNFEILLPNSARLSTNVSPRGAIPQRRNKHLLSEICSGMLQEPDLSATPIMTEDFSSNKRLVQVKSHEILDMEDYQLCDENRRLPSQNDYALSNRMKSRFGTQKVAELLTNHASPKAKLKPARYRNETKTKTTAASTFDKLPNSKSSITEVSETARSGVPSFKELYKERIAAHFNELFKQSGLVQEQPIRSLIKLEEPKRELVKRGQLRKDSDTSIVDHFEDREIGGKEECAQSQTTSIVNSKARVPAHSKTRSFQLILREKMRRNSNFSETVQSSTKSSSTQQSPGKPLDAKTQSPRKSIKKTPKAGSPGKASLQKSPKKTNSPRKKLWNKENDKILEEIEVQTLEKMPAMTFISPSKSTSVLKPTEFCQTFSLQKENRIDEIGLRPAKRDYKVVRKALVDAIKYMQLLKLDPKEISNKKVFSSEPYEKENARELIRAAKMGDLTTVEMLLLQNKYLVYDFDNIHQTALHWAAKRGHKGVVEVLIQNGADLNVKDLLGRTALYYAIQNNNIEILKVLLKARCDPWSTDKMNYAELVRNKPLAKYYLSKCRQIHIMMAMAPTKQENDVWMKESLVLALDPINLPMTSTD